MPKSEIAANRVTSAKTKLVLNYPFFGFLALQHATVEDNSVPTMATDGRTIVYNAKFVEEMTPEHAIFVMAHEVLHKAFMHLTRRGDRDAGLWNIAADYVINNLLNDEKVGTMPPRALYDRDIVAAGGGTTEGVYEYLLQKSEVIENPWPDLREPQPGTESQELESNTKIEIAQATTYARMSGKLSANLERFAAALLYPKLDWREVLRRFVNERIKSDFSWARPRRRLLAHDLYMPTRASDAVGEFIVYVDCSGSISDEELSEFAAEIKAIRDDANVKTLHVAYFDTHILRHDKFERDEDIVIRPIGGGGTSFARLFDWAEEQNINTPGAAVLTDLYGSFPDNAPPFPVLWVVNHEQTTPCPFGDRINM